MSLGSQRSEARLTNAPEYLVRRRAIAWRTTGGRCWYCGRHLHPRDFHLDHLVPRSRGGGDGLNLVPACPPCNLRKGNLDLETFRAREADRQIRPQQAARQSDQVDPTFQFFFERGEHNA